MKGCLAFYRTVFDRLNVDDAIQAMNAAIDPADETFWHVAAETAFMLAFQSYIEGDGSPAGAAALADGFAARRAERVEAERGFPVPPEEVEQWRNAARALLLNHDARFETERRKFFYIDEFPENDSRFDFTLEDLLPKAPRE